jgi:hypothetical protein
MLSLFARTLQAVLDLLDAIAPVVPGAAPQTFGAPAPASPRPAICIYTYGDEEQEVELTIVANDPAEAIARGKRIVDCYLDMLDLEER